jgi:hypothetical protein
VKPEKIVGIILAVVVVVALGIVAASRLMHRSTSEATSTAAQPIASEPGESRPSKPTPAPQAAAPKRVARHEAPVIPPTTPKLQKALKPLLHRGTNMDIAAEGFKSGMQFAAVVHAAQNTEVPFVVLKHHVLDEKKPLAVAIHESKPNVNASREAKKAWAQARAELSTL